MWASTLLRLWLYLNKKEQTKNGKKKEKTRNENTCHEREKILVVRETAKTNATTLILAVVKVAAKTNGATLVLVELVIV